jgi:hypothetical protein
MKLIAGKVIRVDRVCPVSGKSHMMVADGEWWGVHLHLLRWAASDTVHVHLGPAWFVDNQGVKIKVRDYVSIVGANVRFRNEKRVVAARVEKEDETLRLRTMDGRPLWIQEAPS